jgi:hypothetical protein
MYKYTKKIYVLSIEGVSYSRIDSVLIKLLKNGWEWSWLGVMDLADHDYFLFDSDGLIYCSSLSNHYSQAEDLTELCDTNPVHFDMTINNIVSKRKRSNDITIKTEKVDLSVSGVSYIATKGRDKCTIDISPNGEVKYHIYCCKDNVNFVQDAFNEAKKHFDLIFNNLIT